MAQSVRVAFGLERWVVHAFLVQHGGDTAR
jgi:hypothetical protein